MDCPIIARSFTLVACLSLGFMTVSGCGSGSGNVPVHGVVKFEGKPVKLGTVRFFPAAGGRPSIGQIEPDGSYALGTKVAGDGALPGEYAIAIEAIESTTIGQAPKTLAEEIENGPARSTVEYLVPPKYASKETSGLTGTIEPDNYELDFDLE